MNPPTITTESLPTAIALTDAVMEEALRNAPYYQQYLDAHDLRVQESICHPLVYLCSIDSQPTGMPVYIPRAVIDYRRPGVPIFNVRGEFETYEIERVIRICGDRCEVKWVGYPQTTWEPLEAIKHDAPHAANWDSFARRTNGKPIVTKPRTDVDDESDGYEFTADDKERLCATLGGWNGGGNPTDPSWA